MTNIPIGTRVKVVSYGYGEVAEVDDAGWIGRTGTVESKGSYINVRLDDYQGGLLPCLREELRVLEYPAGNINASR